MKKQFQDSKHIVVAALIMDREGRVLILNPEHKDGWILPGGIVERNEPPSAACARQVGEELGIDIVLPKRLLSVDYRGKTDEYIMFIFDCGEFDDGAIAGVKLCEELFIEHRFVQPEEAMRLLRTNSARRLIPTLEAKKNGFIAYLEDEEVF